MNQQDQPLSEATPAPAAPPPPPPPQAALGKWASWTTNAVLVAFWSCWAGLNLVSSLEDNALHVDLRERVFLQAITPQGWAFFTRDPREVSQRVFIQAEAGRLEPANNADYRGEPWNGVRRQLRNRGIVLAHVMSSTPSSAWRPCDGPIGKCVAQSDADASPCVVLRAYDTTDLCGRVVMQEVSPVPWAWRASYRNVHPSSRIAVVDVDCQDLSRGI